MPLPAVVAKLLPFTEWWPRLDRATLRADAIAGLIGAVVVLPQGVAFATLAGLPPEMGLYCAMVPAVVAALFGSSLHAVSGPTNAVSLLVLAALAPLAVPGSAAYASMALTLALVCGVLVLALGVFRLGTIVRFVSDAVVVGFAAGLGLLIVVSQLAPMVGAPTAHATSFLGMARAAFASLAETRAWPLAVGAVTLAAGLAAPHWLRLVPPVLAATIAGTAFAAGANAMLGAGATGIRTLGALPGALPPLSWPDFSPATLASLAGPALGVTILSITQTLAIVRAIALRSGQRIDNNQELIGQGLANLAAAFFSGYPTSASVNRCGINYEAGARTPLSTVIASIVLVLLLAVFAPLAALLPYPAIAGLLILAGWGLIDVPRIRSYVRASRQESAVLGASFVATLVLPLPTAILAGVIASLLVYLNRTSRPQMRAMAPDPRHSLRRFAPVAQGLAECPQLKILAVEGSIYFGAVQHAEAHFATLREVAREQKHLLIVARNINFLDVAGAEALVREARARRWSGGRLWLQGLRAAAEDVLRRGGFLEEIGPDAAFRDKREAIARVFDALDPGICARCRARIFEECASRPLRDPPGPA
ncbi:MAG: SulP family inorganic anion transporter [Burkholderiales bacterium]